MNRNFYKNRVNLIKTEISGGREHFTTRPKFTFIESYEYACGRGDNLYSLADEKFGSDKLWNILEDVNLPMFPEDLYVDKVIIVPKTVVEIENSNVVVL